MVQSSLNYVAFRSLVMEEVGKIASPIKSDLLTRSTPLHVVWLLFIVFLYPGHGYAHLQVQPRRAYIIGLARLPLSSATRCAPFLPNDPARCKVPCRDR